MQIVRLVLLLLHILAFATLLGALLAQAREPAKRITGVMRDGAGTAMVTGLALVAVLELSDASVDHIKIATKAGITVVVLGLVLANRRKERIGRGLWLTILALTVSAVVVALFWSPAHGSY